MPPSTSRASNVSRRRASVVVSVSVTVLTFGVIGPGASAAAVHTKRAAAACPATVDATRFATTQQLRAIPGMQVHSDPYEIDRWQPTTKTQGGRGRDLARAGGLTVTTRGGTRSVPVSGAVPFSLPNGANGTSGPLVYLSADEPITAADAQGKVVVREVPPAS